MAEGFLLSRVLLRFSDADEDLVGELSAAAFTPDGSLWLGSDEFLTVERLSPVGAYVYGEHKSFNVSDFVELFNDEDEIDIEGMDYADHYLWLTGSHSTKRKTPKGKNTEKDLKRLAKVSTDANRYLLIRIPVKDGELVKSCLHPDDSDVELNAACLEKTGDGNILIEVLKDDDHLGPFLSFPLPSKENGFDVEGLAVRGNRLFLGFRGPVLGGWAVILEIEVEEKETGVLALKAIGKGGAKYKKHFVDLDGLGVRELCLRGDDLLILAGPTMDLVGSLRVFRLKDIMEHEANSVSDQNAGDLEVLFDLPAPTGGDKAEGLALLSGLEQADSLLVVYDSPLPTRRPAPTAVFADIFSLISV